jgi:3-oxoacyl-[acyl-carrier-protein] synthase II
LSAGRSGVKPVSILQDTPFPVQIGAEVTDFDGKQYVTPRKSMKVMSREIQFAFAAASLAIQDAALNTADVDRDRFGVVFGSEMMYSAPGELIDAYTKCVVDGKFTFSQWGDRAMSNLYPLWMLKYLPNMPACHIAIAHDARGPNNTFTLGEVSSLLALMEASRCIQRGQADVMVTGGTGSRLNITGMVFRGAKELSHRNDAPTEACRPFDADRDGIVNGEGSGAFVIEEASHAAARGAKVLARVLGFGSSFESPANKSARRGTGVRTSIQLALREAKLVPADIGHVNAHGLSTVVDDAIEAAAIHELLGDVPVTAPKSYFGHLGSGTGSVEMAVSVLALEQGAIPRTLNYHRPDPSCPVDVVHGQSRAATKPTALVLNQSYSGQTAAVVLSGA